ncbi:MAG: Trm112 family protein [Bacteroidota bacterium]
MQKKLLEKLCCPFDKDDLNISVFTEEDGEIYEGLLTCPTCNRYYPIIYGLPIMTPDEYRQKQLEAPVLNKWGLHTNPDEKIFTLQHSEPPKSLES